MLFFFNAFPHVGQEPEGWHSIKLKTGVAVFSKNAAYEPQHRFRINLQTTCEYILSNLSITQVVSTMVT